MSDMPEEVTGEILRRLPVKRLLRFRCVCKSWCSLIDNKQFIRLHLQHSLRSKSNRAILVESSELYYVDLDSCKRLELDFASIQPYTVIASCDGLVLLVSKSVDVALWNPSTRKMSRLLEQEPFTDRFIPYESVEIIFALGYDSKHDDYKVVRVLQGAHVGNKARFTSEAAIHSLKSNSWKRTADFPYLLSRHTSRWGVYLNDALHAVVERGESEVIMAFNLVTEEHRDLPMPPFHGGYGGIASVEVLEGVLAAVVPGEKMSFEIWNIWLMKEYGVKKSWMKLLQFGSPILHVYHRCGDLRPLAYSESGEEVLLKYDGLCDRSLSWYNLRTKSAKSACVSGLSLSSPVFDAEFCVGSLVSPFSPGTVEPEKLENRQMKKGKKKTNKKRDDFLSVGFKLKL